MSNEKQRDSLIHALAVLTAVVSLAPICLGSLVTTLGAGMAFPDWPTSDGQGMLAYPWLQSTGDRFIEHGHRLAGMLIGFCAIGLCVAAYARRTAREIQIACALVLAGVVVQGILGGIRVLLDRQTVAFAHSVFGCCVFVALWMVSSATSRSWQIVDRLSEKSKMLNLLAWAYPVLVILQYVMGGVIRHLGSMLHAHIAGAIGVFLLSSVVFGASLRSDLRSVRTRGWLVAAAVLLQIFVGVTVWITKFGLPTFGLVAVQHSFAQVVARTSHTVIGMVVVATAVSWSVNVIRSSGLRESKSGSVDSSLELAVG